MKLKISFRKIFSWSCLFLLLVISLSVITNILVQKPEVQQYLLKKVCIGYGLDVKTGKMGISIFSTPGVVIHDVELNLRDKSCRASVLKLKINFSGKRLFRGELIPVSLDIIKPVITIPEEYATSLLKKDEKNAGSPPIFCSSGIMDLNIQDGNLLIAGPSNISLTGLTTRISHIRGTTDTYKISGNGNIKYRSEESEFGIIGSFNLDSNSIYKSIFSASVTTSDTPLTWIYCPAEKVKIEGGYFSSSLNIIGSPEKGINMGGAVKLKSAKVSLFHRDRQKQYNVSDLDCHLNASFRNRIIHIDTLKAKNKDADLNVDITLDFNNPEDPYFKLIGTSRFMTADTFIRNFPTHITSPWLKDRLFPMFEKGMVRIDRLSLDGTIDQFKNIKDDENPSIIDMSLTCESFTISNMGIKIPVRNVSAQVNIVDGNLKISHLSGLFGDSHIGDASLDVRGMIGGNPVYKVFVEGDFDIRELMSYRDLDVMPEKVREEIEKHKELDGRLTAKTTLGYRSEWGALRILKGDYLFRDTLFHERPFDIPLRFSRIEFNFPGDDNNTFSGEGTWGSSTFLVSGNTAISGNELLCPHADVRAMADINEIIGAGKESPDFPFIFRGPFPVTISFDRDETTYRYSGSINTEKLVIESDNFLINAEETGNRVSFTVTQYGLDRLDLNDIDFKTGNSNLKLSGRYDIEKKKFNSLTAESKALSIDDFGLQFKKIRYAFLGTLAGKLDISFPEKGLKGMQVAGDLSGNKISFISGLFPLPVQDCTFNMNFSGKEGILKESKMIFGDYPLQLTGTFSGWDRLAGNFQASADYLDLTKILLNNKNELKEDQDTAKKQGKKYPDINLVLHALNGIWRKMDFKNLDAEIGFKEKEIIIKNAAMDLNNGDISLSGVIDRDLPSKVNIAGKINLADQKIEKLFSDMELDEAGMRGTLSLNSSLTLDGDLKQGITKNLSGDVDSLTIKEGLFENSRVFLKILDLLNIPDKFRTRPEGMREEGFYFKSFEGSGKIEKGILTTEGFVLKSPAFNAVGSGEENLYEQTHNLRLLIQPLTNFDFIMGHIPLVKHIFTDGDESLFTVGYDVTGTWSKPDLDYAPIENLKGIAGLFKRTLLTPVKIIEGIGNAAKSMKKSAAEEKEPEEAPETENK